MGCQHDGFRGSGTYHCSACNRKIGKPLLCECGQKVAPPLMIQGSRFFLTCKCGKDLILYQPQAKPIERIVSVAMEYFGSEVVEIAVIQEIPGICNSLADAEMYHRFYKPKKTGDHWIFGIENTHVFNKQEILDFIGDSFILGDSGFDVTSFYGNVSFDESCVRAGIARTEGRALATAWDTIRIFRKEIGLDPL